jgi:predicted O-methyltransferase YrrM
MNLDKDYCFALRENVRLLNEHIDHKPNSILEIGSYKGGSTWIWLESFLSEDGTIVCIEPFDISDQDPFSSSDISSDPEIEKEFYNIVSWVKKSNQTVELRKGRSYQELAKLISEQRRFDLIYIDGNHTGAAVIADACMAFGMLNKGGIMLFDDFFWHDSVGVNGQSLNTLDWPKMAIDAFTTLYHTHLEILFINYQYAIRKW